MRDRPALRRPSAPPVAPDQAAQAHLRFIREAMQRTTTFTAVPGWGGVAMGVTAIIAALVAYQQDTVVDWMRVWAAEALIGFALGVFFTAQKARKHGVPLLSGQGRKFLLGMLPAVLAGFALLVTIGFGIALRTRDVFRKFLAAGLTLVIGIQAFLILAGVLRLFPVTGITLPFMSYGGSSLVANMILVTLLARISHGEEA